MGQGSIGRVYFGCWQETQVALKVIGNAPIPESGFQPAREIPANAPLPTISDQALLRTLEREASSLIRGCASSVGEGLV